MRGLLPCWRHPPVLTLVAVGKPTSSGSVICCKPEFVAAIPGP